MNGETATEEKAPQTSSRGGRFVRPGQRFIGVFGGRRAWNIVIAIAGFAALGVLAIFGEIILNLQNQLAQRQPYIVGLTTAHQFVPLFPDGAAPVTCDALCIDGELESWVVNLRTITGEQDTAQTCAAPGAGDRGVDGWRGHGRGPVRQAILCDV